MILFRTDLSKMNLKDLDIFVTHFKGAVRKMELKTPIYHGQYLRAKSGHDKIAGELGEIRKHLEEIGRQLAATSDEHVRASLEDRQKTLKLREQTLSRRTHANLISVSRPWIKFASSEKVMKDMQAQLVELLEYQQQRHAQGS